MPKLQILSLHENKLRGQLPASWTFSTAFQQLEEIYIQNNEVCTPAHRQCTTPVLPVAEDAPRQPEVVGAPSSKGWLPARAALPLPRDACPALPASHVCSCRVHCQPTRSLRSNCPSCAFWTCHVRSAAAAAADPLLLPVAAASGCGARGACEGAASHAAVAVSCRLLPCSPANASTLATPAPLLLLCSQQFPGCTAPRVGAQGHRASHDDPVSACPAGSRWPPGWMAG